MFNNPKRSLRKEHEADEENVFIPFSSPDGFVVAKERVKAGEN